MPKVERGVRSPVFSFRNKTHTKTDKFSGTENFCVFSLFHISWNAYFLCQLDNAKTHENKYPHML